MSEKTKEIKQDLLDIRYFAETMLGALFANDQQEQKNTLFKLAKLIEIMNRIDRIRVYINLVKLWNMDTMQYRNKSVTDDQARQTVFRFFGDIFAKYGLPDPGYEEDEL